MTNNSCKDHPLLSFPIHAEQWTGTRVLHGIPHRPTGAPTPFLSSLRAALRVHLRRGGHAVLRPSCSNAHLSPSS